MLKVAYVTSLCGPGLPNVHGVPRVSEVFLQAIASEQAVAIDVYVISDAVTGRVEIKGKRGKIVYFPSRRGWGTANIGLLGAYRCLKELMQGEYDIVHAQPPVENFLVAMFSGRATILTLHGLILREYAGITFSEWWRWASGGLREAICLMALQQVRTCISIARYISDYVSVRGRGRSLIIPNPVEAAYGSLDPACWDGLRIICVGTVSRRKNQLSLIKACKLLKENGIRLSCRIVGQPLDAWNECTAFVREQRLEDVVEFTGAVSNNEVLAAYNWANIVVLPSLAESSPLSIAQGMIAGRLCIGANSGGIPEILGDGQYGVLVRPNDVSDLAEKIAHCLRAPHRSEALAAVGCAYARRHFSLQAVVGKTMQVYMGVAKMDLANIL